MYTLMMTYIIVIEDNSFAGKMQLITLLALPYFVYLYHANGLYIFYRMRPHCFTMAADISFVTYMSKNRT